MAEQNEDDILHLYEAEHAAEIAAEAGKPFELTGASESELPVEAAQSPPASAPDSGAAAPSTAAAAASPAPSAGGEERLSPIQKIARMTVGERVKLAMLGNKEERSILIRDGSRVVYSAVLASPKLSDAEVETIAAMKNVQEGVLRELARNRKFMKSYPVVRALVNNPRCPVDISLTFLKMLMVPDLRGVSLNKNVSEMVRKVALKMFKERSAPPGKKPE